MGQRRWWRRHERAAGLRGGGPYVRPLADAIPVRQDVRHPVVPGVRRHGTAPIGVRAAGGARAPAHRHAPLPRPPASCGCGRTAASCRPSTRHRTGRDRQAARSRPVDDTASNVPQNPNYQWTRTLDVAAVAARVRARHPDGGVDRARRPARRTTACGRTGSGCRARRVRSWCRTGTSATRSAYRRQASRSGRRAPGSRRWGRMGQSNRPPCPASTSAADAGQTRYGSTASGSMS